MKRKRKVGYGAYKKPRLAGPNAMILANQRVASRAGYRTVARTRGVYGQGEMKYFDSFLSAQAIGEGVTWAAAELDPATLLTLFCPIEGSAINQRIGRKVKVYKIKIRGFITTTAASDQVDILNSPIIRLILVHDMQTNSAQAQAEEVMANPGAATTALNTCVFQNLANFGRFRVLKDKIFRPGVITAVTDGASTSSQGLQQMPFKWNINYKGGMEVQFNATNGGTIADVVNNSWHIIGTKANTNFDTAINYQCRVCYKE